MKNKNGFTLVELLAVIVVLAIIMIIAIPAVLDIMNGARKKSFALAIDKYVTAVQQQYVSDSNFGQIKGAGIYVYNIKDHLGLTSTGDNEGYVVVDATDVDKVEYYVFMHDSNYRIIGYPIVAKRMPDKDSDDIRGYSASEWTAVGNELLACQSLFGQTVQCLDPHGYVLSN